MTVDKGASSDEPPYPEKVRGVSVVPKPSRERLGGRELIDYGQHRSDLLRWAFDLGKNPDRAEGYAQKTVHGRAYRLDQFYRWVWDEYGGYTTHITHDHADDYTRYLVRRDGGDEDKSNHQKAIKMLFKWRDWKGTGEMWDPDVTINSNSGSTNPADFFTVEERSQIRETVLSFDSVPNYSNCTPEQRDRIKQHLAQRFEKPKREVTPDDFERANSWKLPSLFWTALDTGLRPIEVKRANVSWVDTSNNVLRIPKEESSKNTDNWIVSLTDRTAGALRRWLNEREAYQKYEDSPALWLNRQGNRYEGYSLNRILREICDEAGIDRENRDVSFYSIRHSVGTYMTREEGLAAAQAQLRHKSQQTTMRYDQAPVEDRRDALNRMG